MIGRAAAGLAARPRRALALALLIAAVSVLLASRLHPTSAVALLADPHGARAHATQRLDRAFGAEPLTLVAEGDRTTVLDPRTLAGLLGLEGRIARLPGVHAVTGPGTFLNQTVIQMERIARRQFGGAAGRAAAAADAAEVEVRRAGGSPADIRRARHDARLAAIRREEAAARQLLVRFGFIGVPSILNRSFVDAIVLGTGVDPKPKMRWLFPDARHAVVIVRPDAGLSDARVRALGARIRELSAGARIHGLRFTVSGTPLLAAAVADEVRGELVRLAPVGIAVMLLVLLIGFRRGRRRLRMMGLALVATAATAAATEVAGLGLSPATVAALPVILGLALDYAVQLQARYWAERGDLRPEEAARAAAAGVAPALGLAGAAAIAGSLTLTLGRVPLLDRLGWTLAIGTATSLGTVLLLAPAALVAGDRGGARPPVLGGSAWRVTRRVLLLAAFLGPAAAVGIALSGQAQLQSDVRNLVPRGLGELTRAEHVQQELGVSGQLRVAVTAPDVTAPAVLRWMLDAQRQILATDRRLRPGPNLAEVLASSGGGQLPSPATSRRLVALLPPYLVDAIVSRDRRTAELSFGIPLVAVTEQARILHRIDRVLAAAPPGVRATPGGLAAEAAESTDSLRADRPRTLLIAAAVIALLLLLATGSAVRAVVPLIPSLLAAGLSSVVVLLAGVELSPFSAGLEPLVLAVGVEFGLLLQGRYRELRRTGLSASAAARATETAVGASVVISAATVSAGFLTLAAGRIQAVSQFGVLVALELVLCTAAAVATVPRLCALTEGWTLRGGLVRASDALASAWGRAAQRV